MITSRVSVLAPKKVLLALGDCAVVAGAIVAASVMRLGWSPGQQYVRERAWEVLAALVLFPLAFYVVGLYDSRRLRAPARAAFPAAGAIALALLLAGAHAFAHASPPVGRGIVLELAVLAFVGVMTLRVVYANTPGILASRCLVVGTRQDAAAVAALVRDHPEAGLDVAGLVLCEDGRRRARDAAAREPAAAYPVLGGLDALAELVSLHRVDRLIVPTAIHECPELLRRLRPLRYRGVSLMDVVSLHEELVREIPLDRIDDEWLFRAATMSSQVHIRRLKRVTDVVLTLVLLVPALAILGIAALAIRLGSRGPILFRQERVGLGSKPFMVLKLRTMSVDAEKLTGPVWSTDQDPRITPVGRVLRKFRIDELPQLFNVLRGDMSLVGPRPERPVFVEQLSGALPFYSERLMVRPGITGWAQVMAPYASTVGDSMRKLQFDLYYTKHLSFSLDLLIFFMTAKTVLFGRERAQGGMVAGQHLALAPALTPAPLDAAGGDLAPVSLPALREELADRGALTGRAEIAQA